MTIYGLINQFWLDLISRSGRIVLSLVDTSNSVGNFSPPWGCDLTNEMTAKDLEMHAS